jgi:hypothetical protein
MSATPLDGVDLATVLNSELQPCPFCAKTPILSNTATEAVIWCGVCRLMMKHKHARYTDVPAITALVGRWNTRA